MIAFLYARVSTKDKGQDVENQLAQLRAFARRERLKHYVPESFLVELGLIEEVEL